MHNICGCSLSSFWCCSYWKISGKQQKSFQRPSLLNWGTKQLMAEGTISEVEQSFGCNGVLDFPFSLFNALSRCDGLMKWFTTRWWGKKTKTVALIIINNSSFARKNIKLLNLFLNIQKCGLGCLAKDLLTYSKTSCRNCPCLKSAMQDLPHRWPHNSTKTGLCF